MFTELFATMNELLLDIMKRYPEADPKQQELDEEQLDVLKAMSAKIIDEWLSFEEKMALFQEQVQEQQQGKANNKGDGTLVPRQSALAPEMAEIFNKGQGYFKLFMFKHAADHFKQVVMQAPEFMTARLFLAMTFMHLQEWQEAQRHFQFMVQIGEEPKLQALCLNALGCIQAIRMNMEQAESYFIQAHDTDPSFEDPLNNLQACRRRNGHLSLYFGSAQLSCL